MKHWSKQEQLMLSILLGLLLVGWAVKAYYSARPAVRIIEPARH